MVGELPPGMPGLSVDDPELGLLLAEAVAAAYGQGLLVRGGGQTCVGAPGLTGSEPVRVLGLAAPELVAGEDFAADFVLAGGAVLRGGFAGDLAALAERTGLGVLNAFTAKGLFRWDSPFHLGTGCLQEHDLRLAGAGPDSAVLVVGVDVNECGNALLASAGLDPALPNWRTVAPWELKTGAAGVRARRGGPDQPPAQPELFHALWNVAQPLYGLGRAPLNPARAAADVAAALGPHGVVCAEPGLAGWWIGRTVPTTAMGSVAIPAAGRAGAAVARAIIVAQKGNPALAIVDGPMGSSAAALIELGNDLGLSIAVEVWGPSGQPMDAGSHVETAKAALASPGVTVYDVAIDYAPNDQLIAAAGPLVAWT
jgi:hypothetical protein